jgi:hypothetical protein
MRYQTAMQDQLPDEAAPPAEATASTARPAGDAAVTGVATGYLGTGTALEDTQEWIVPEELRTGKAAAPAAIARATVVPPLLSTPDDPPSGPVPASPVSPSAPVAPAAAPAPTARRRSSGPTSFAATPRAAGIAAAALLALIAVAAVVTSHDAPGTSLGTAPVVNPTPVPTQAPPADAGGANGNGKGNGNGGNGGNGKGNGNGNGHD